MSTGDGWRVLRAAASPPLLRSGELCPGSWAYAGGQAFGDAEVSGTRTKGSLERVGPQVPRPEPRLQDFIAPTPARDAAEYRSAQTPRQLPTLGIGCRSHNRSGGVGGGREERGGEGDFAKCRVC